VPFKPGQSGNPTCRPKGVKDRRVALHDKLLPHADQLIEMATTFAKSGDMTAMKIVMDRIIPPLRDEPIHVSTPNIESVEDCVRAQAAVVNALAAGEILPSDGQVMSALIEAQCRAYETHEMAKRLDAIEKAITRKDDRS
jgi:hypothetical protein